jgi:Holliday junction resolvase RusA-like endonuclease
MGAAQKRKVKRLKNGKSKVTKKNCLTLSLADLESVVKHESLAKVEATPLATRCNIHIHSKRKRLTDADGASAKAVIDGLVHGGLLQDDSSQFVKEVSYSQEQSKEEETIIEIWEV